VLQEDPLAVLLSRRRFLFLGLGRGTLALLVGLPVGRTREATVLDAVADALFATELSRVEFVERMAALVPPPRANTVGAVPRGARGPVGLEGAGAAARTEAVTAPTGSRGSARQEAVHGLPVGAMGLAVVARLEPVWRTST